MNLGEMAPACVHCGGSHRCAEDQIITLLTEIRDNQRAHAPARAGEIGTDVVRSIAEELQSAANALEQSARQLKDDGKGWRAGHAHQAAVRARQVAQELLGQ